jgi:trigger factor
MKVTLEKLPDSQISLEIEIPAETSKNTYEKVVQDLARSTNLPGFRKGKIPRQILLQRLGVERVKAVAVEEMIQKSLEAALEQEEITSLGNYKLLSNFDELVKGFEPDAPLIFAASVDVPPTVELGDYQALEISAEEKVYDPQSVEDWLADRQEEMANLIPVEERAAAMGDVAFVDYQGKYSEGDGSVIPGVEGTYLRVDMNEGRFIEGMVEGIVGMTLDETRDIPLVFPDDYPREDVAGKAVTFTVTLKELKAKHLPELDDDFVQEASNNEHETLEELRDSLDKRFSEEASKATQENIEAALVSKLLEIAQVDLPGTLIEQEITQVLMQTAAQMEQLGLDVRSIFSQDHLKELRSNARPEAITRLSRKLIIAEIAQREGLQVEPEAVKERMTEIIKQVNPQDIDFGKLNEVVREEILTEKTLAWLRERAEVTLTPPAPETATSEEE